MVPGSCAYVWFSFHRKRIPSQKGDSTGQRLFAQGQGEWEEIGREEKPGTSKAHCANLQGLPPRQHPARGNAETGGEGNAQETRLG